MKKFFTRIVTVFLLVAMIVTSISPGAAYAANSFSATDLEAADSTAAGEDTDAVDKEQSGQNTTEQPSTESTEQKEDADKTAAKENSSKDTEADTDQQEKNTKSKDSKKADAAKADAENINFVYVESPYLETPGTQRIVFYFEEAISGAEVSALIVKDESGKETKWALAKQKDGLYLFEKTFNDKDASGTYQAVRLELTADGKSQVISLSDLGVEAEFGVNEEYDGLEELQPINEEEAGNLGASVVTIDENGTTQAQTSIANALNSVSAKTRSAKTARAGDIIVALDPGHDSKSTGASANGLKEEVLTLKIANYCKEELEKYDGVKVYMTRTTAACPFNMSGSGCIQKRVNAAADAGAQIFVSFHLNSSTSTSAKGAEIIIPNKNWRPAVAAEGEELAEAILDELVKVGVTKRATPIYSKSASSDKYSNGTAADYFAVQRYSKLRNIPGIIIEHGFITNSNDVNKFLKTESGLKKLGVADATGIAKYLGLSQGQWKTDSKGNKYYYENGKKVTGEKYISGYWYYFDQNGVMKTGWHSFSNKKVYYDSNGRMVKGEKYISGKWYLFDNWTGGMVTGWYDFSNKRVYYDSNGAMIKGEKTINGKSYYFNKTTGAMVKNDFVGNKYYGSDGVLVPESKYSSVFYKIEGSTATSIDQMVRLYEDKSPIAYPSKDLKSGGAATIKEFATIYYEEAKKEGIKAEVAWAQTMHETGWLKFGGQVKISQYNFAGLGATDGGASGAKFKDVRTGVRAQIQHLKAYASTAKLNQTCVDPRFNYVKRGCAQYVEILGQKENPKGYGWATSEKYGVTVSNLIKELKKA